MVSSRFQSLDYLSFRQEYPAALFQPLKTFLWNPERPVQVLDLGAGTGFVAASFLRFFPFTQLTLLEPDASMLDAARKYLSEAKLEATALLGVSEKIPLADQSVDHLLVGSAWHWMKPSETLSEVDRVLKPGGTVFVFEYQFPKAEEKAAAVNEWIRREFNLRWKAPFQVPRGSLFEITEGIRSHSQFAQIRSIRLTEARALTPGFLAGVIFSQSRFQHFEATVPETEKGSIRKEVVESLQKRFGADEFFIFQYFYEGYLFRKRSSTA